MAEKKEIKKIKVLVKDVPVRHDHQDYEPGEELEIEVVHFNENLFKKVE